MILIHAEIGTMWSKFTVGLRYQAKNPSVVFISNVIRVVIFVAGHFHFEGFELSK